MSNTLYDEQLKLLNQRLMEVENKVTPPAQPVVATESKDCKTITFSFLSPTQSPIKHQGVITNVFRLPKNDFVTLNEYGVLHVYNYETKTFRQIEKYGRLLTDVDELPDGRLVCLPNSSELPNLYVLDIVHQQVFDLPIRAIDIEYFWTFGNQLLTYKPNEVGLFDFDTNVYTRYRVPVQEDCEEFGVEHLGDKKFVFWAHDVIHIVDLATCPIIE